MKVFVCKPIAFVCLQCEFFRSTKEDDYLFIYLLAKQIIPFMELKMNIPQES